MTLAISRLEGRPTTGKDSYCLVECGRENYSRYVLAEIIDEDGTMRSMTAGMTKGQMFSYLIGRFDGARTVIVWALKCTGNDDVAEILCQTRSLDEDDDAEITSWSKDDITLN